MPPPGHVCAAFGAVGAPVPLPGGRGTAWRVGEFVLKPLDLLPDELRWLHETAGSRPPSPDVRLSAPVASRAGVLAVDGWTAWPALPGEHRTGRWEELAQVARAFSEQFAGVGRPAFLDRRAHAWVRADRLAWGEAAARDVADAPFLPALLAARAEVADAATIVHGDLAGNVLFDAALPPAVIDPTVYWRPVRYAVAVIAVDAVCFEGAPLSLLERIDSGRDVAQYLLRALVFRIATDWFDRRPAEAFIAYHEAVSRVLELTK